MKANTVQSELVRALSEHANKTAIEHADKRLTYAELDRKSNQISHELLSRGVKKGTFVGILLDDRSEMITAILGILKAGCVFVPLDTAYPDERLNTMMRITDTRLLFVDERNEQTVTFEAVEKIRLDEAHDAAGGSGDAWPAVDYTPDDPLYIFFTSGSSGPPKAVVGRNESLWHFITWEIEEFGIGSDVRVSQFTSPCHNPMLRDIFVALFSGGTICIPESKEKMVEKHSLIQFIEESKVHLIHCTGSLFRIFNCELLQPGHFPHLKHVLLAGERTTPKHLTNWFDVMGERIQLVNLYGQTETTLAKVFHRIVPEDVQKTNIPIGKPISGTQVAILDKDMKMCPPGVVGEIHIRTPYRSLGYYNNLEMTNEKFIINPFTKNPKDIIYKTGDLGRFLRDGNIEFMGRADRQIKIRGFRIELNEIENTIVMHADVREAAVIHRENANGELLLYAYLVMHDPRKDHDTAELRAFVAEKLPDYMVPHKIVFIEKMPMTPNGKLDYKGLPDTKEVTAYLPPQGNVEEALARLWREILGMERVSRDEKFLELGGHSLNVMALVFRVHEEFGIELPLQQVFSNISLQQMAAFIEEANGTGQEGIQPALKQEAYALSSAQKRLFVLNQLEPDNTFYNIPYALLAEGQLDEARLQQAFEALIDRHEVLRTTFDVREQEPVQIVHDAVPFALERFAASEAEMDGVLASFIRPFDLGQAPLFRIGVVEMAPERHVLMIDLHHIISDGTTMNLLIRDFVELYKGNRLEPLAIHFKDYAAWQIESRASERMKAQEAFWTGVFADEVPVLELPTDFPRPAVQRFEGSKIEFGLNGGMTEQVKRIAEQTGSTVYMVLLAAYNVLLAKYTGQEDIVVGSPIAGRTHADLQHMAGLFVNTLALRNKPRSSLPFREFLTEVKAHALLAYEHQDYPFEELIEQAGVRRDTSRNPLFDTMFVLQNIEEAALSMGDLSIQPYPFAHEISKLDLTLEGWEEQGELRFQFEYSTALFQAATVERMARHFVRVVEQAVSAPDQLLSGFDLMSAEERQQVLVEFNNRKHPHPTNRTLPELFEEQAVKTPDAQAVFDENGALTYRELNQRANQLAHALRARGAGPERIVAIAAERTVETVVGILGILKSGSAYLPLDPAAPLDRIAFQLEDSRAILLLAPPGWTGLEAFAGEQIVLDQHMFQQEEAGNPELVNEPSDLAYVIYTSGSTGRPKGVMIEHRNVVNYMGVLFDHVFSRYETPQNFAMISPFVFDASILPLFGTLTHGHRLAVVSERVRKDADALAAFYREQQIELTELTPSHLHVLAEVGAFANGSLKHLIVGGEEVKPAVVNKLSQQLRGTLRITNAYGPTEVTVDATYHDLILPAQVTAVRLPIGKPLPNCGVHILTSGGQLAPIGVPGELCVSGEGVARGYLNRPNLTAEKFVQHPYLPKERIYRTGDLARWLPDGTVEYLGRMDSQVKIRGFRIELSEIEHGMLQHPAVQEAAVLDFEDAAGQKFLSAYYVSPTSLSVPELREHLLASLPSYMVPAFFVPLHRLPLSVNGKVDRKALPAPDTNAASTGIEVAPATATEQKLAAMWKHVLGTEAVGAEDNFFDRGGHSLTATLLVSRINQEFGMQMPLREIFRLQTLRELAAFVDSETKQGSVSIPVAEPQKSYPVSSAQKRMMIQQEWNEENTAYNLPFMIRIQGAYDAGLLERALQQLTERHESLRTSFAWEEGAPVQVIRPHVSMPLHRMASTEADAGALTASLIRPFQLGEAPLMRAHLIELGAADAVLFIDSHHIIMDGVSVNVFLEDLFKLYHGESLTPLRIQYKDFAVWESSRIASGEISEQEAYWLDVFREEPPLLALPTDYPRTEENAYDYEGDRVAFEADEKLTRAVRARLAETQSTMFMFLMAAYHVLLAKFAGQEDVVVGTPIAGRRHAELEPIIGMFVNTLAIRTRPQKDNTFRAFLAEVRQHVLQAYDNQDAQFEHLVEQLGVERQDGRNPLFDAMFLLEHLAPPQAESETLSFLPFENGYTMAKFDLTLAASEEQDRLLFQFDFKTKLFKKETVQLLARSFVTLLERIVQDDFAQLKDIDLLEGVELQEDVLFADVEFNL